MFPKTRVAAPRPRALIVREGWPFILLGAGLTLTAALLLAPGVAAVLLVLTAFTAWFFRNPEREIPPGDKVLVAPADGRVVAAGEAEDPRYGAGPALRVGIFMNVFDVHVNRIPYPGRVVDIQYRPGRFLSANRDKASRENEQNAVLLESPEGHRIMVVQIAGLVARRIACWVRKGEMLDRGQRFGLIRFGSRVDVYLPREARLRVRTGQRVRAGETVLGEMP